eukprot:m.304678 g.304678  ORF g.304678 m.304678 type:complete len:144 (-) comp55273_c1_seq12:250-681(-)
MHQSSAIPPVSLQKPLPTTRAASDAEGATSRGRPAGKRAKKTNSIGHTQKEKLRRANIVHSCDDFREIVPNVRDADKATVFRVAVKYVAYLRSQYMAAQMEALDANFVAITPASVFSVSLETYDNEGQGSVSALHFPYIMKCS